MKKLLVILFAFLSYSSIAQVRTLLGPKGIFIYDTVKTIGTNSTYITIPNDSTVGFDSSKVVTDVTKINDSTIRIFKGGTAVVPDIEINGNGAGGGGGSYLAGKGLVLYGNTFQLQDTLNGNATKLMWLFDKAAFRAGKAKNLWWNIDSIGVSSAAFGDSVKASGTYSFAAGYGSQATGNASVALGGGTASGAPSFAFGTTTRASGINSVAGGNNNNSSGSYSTSFGSGNTASANYTVAMGENNTSSFADGVTIGSGNTASTSANNTAIGFGSTANGGAAIALGTSVTASGLRSLATGYFAQATGTHAFTQGTNTRAKGFGGSSFGSFNDPTAATSATAFNVLNRAFELGIGAAGSGLETNAYTTLFNGSTGYGAILVPTARIHLPPSTAVAGTSVLKFTSTISKTTTGAAGTGSVVTLTFATNVYPAFPPGSQVVVAGITPVGYNGTYTVVASTATTITYAGSTTGAQTVAGTITMGALLTTPEAGAVEFDGTNYFVTSSTTRYTLEKALTNTATLDFGNTSAQSSADLTITVTGAADGDAVTIGVPNASTLTNSSFTAWVSAANTVTVRFNNYSSGSQDPASGTFRASVVKY